MKPPKKAKPGPPPGTPKVPGSGRQAPASGPKQAFSARLAPDVLTLIRASANQAAYLEAAVRAYEQAATRK